MHVQSSCLTNKNLLLFLPFSLPLLPKLPLVVIQKFCYHDNVTSHFFSLLTSQTFTANDKRQFVPRDKVSPGSNVVVYCPLCVDKNESAECHVKLFRTVLSAYFLIWEIVNLNFTFVVYRKRDSKLVTIYKRFPEKCGWKVNGTRLTVSFQWKISGRNRTFEKEVRFFRTEYFKQKSLFHLLKSIFNTSFRLSRPFFGKRNLCISVNGKHDSGMKFQGHPTSIIGKYLACLPLLGFSNI